MPEQEQSDLLSYVLHVRFQIGATTMGIEASAIQEIVKVGEILTVHDAPRSVRGIRNLRGKITTVIDLADHLGYGVCEIGDKARMLIIEHNHELFGFLVDEVHDIINVNLNQLEQTGSQPVNAEWQFIEGIWREDASLTSILRTAALFEWQDAEIA